MSKKRKKEGTAETSPRASRPRTIQNGCPEQPYVKKRSADL